MRQLPTRRCERSRTARRARTAELLDAVGLGAREATALDLAFVVISHDLAVVRHLSEYVLAMYRGNVVEEGPIDAVLSSPSEPYTKRLLASEPRLGMSLAARARPA